jgi:hypothetical protein
MKSATKKDSFASRRDFLKTSGGAFLGTALAGAIASRSYAGEDNAIKIALVGCGSRGTGAAANALSAAGPKTLYAMADVFQFRLDGCSKSLSQEFEKQVDVPKERQFLGLDAYKNAIDAVAPGGVVFLTTPPAFRPIHLEYAVEKGCHVFMEKSFAVDAPGIRRVLKAGEMSLHHGHVFHSSEPNTSDDRRIGFAMMFIPAHVESIIGRRSATLVSGADRHGYWDHDPLPTRDRDPVIWDLMHQANAHYRNRTHTQDAGADARS